MNLGDFISHGEILYVKKQEVFNHINQILNVFLPLKSILQI